MSAIQESLKLALELLSKVASTLQAIPVDDGGGSDDGNTIIVVTDPHFPLAHYFDNHYFDARYFDRRYFG